MTRPKVDKSGALRSSRSRGHRTSELRDFIVDAVATGTPSVARATARHFGITRQAVHKHIRALIQDGVLSEEGVRRGKRYALAVISTLDGRDLPLDGLEEHVVWQQLVLPWLDGTVSENVARIAHFGVTEMINNAIDHSEGTKLFFSARRTARVVEFFLHDDGIGIFQKIRQALRLADEREGVLELTKGKLTTDPERHSGEGIFFTSRMCDAFTLASGETALLTQRGVDWALESAASEGTLVVMKINLDTTKTPNDVFDEYATVDGGFDRTNVPVSLAKYGPDALVSRSQAKRLLSRFERFKEVILDFHDVTTIGQAFADEVFRVFAKSHPDVRLIPINANARVKRFIQRAELAALEERGVPVSGSGEPSSE